MPARSGPEPARLADFAPGNRGGPALDRVGGHVEPGPVCTTAPRAFDGLAHSLLSQLRQPADPDATSEPAVPQEGLAPPLSLPKRWPASGARAIGGLGRLGKFELLGRLEAGSFGAVFRPAKPDTLRRIRYKKSHPTCRGA